VDTAYSIDYSVPLRQPKMIRRQCRQEELEKRLRDQERSEIAEEMIAEVKDHPKSQPGVVAADWICASTARSFGSLALVAFDGREYVHGDRGLRGPAGQSFYGHNNPKDGKSRS